MTEDLKFRRADEGDVEFVAKHANQAGEGFPLIMWQRMGDPECNPWTIGCKRVRSDDSPIFYKRAWIAELGGTRVGCLICKAILEGAMHDSSEQPEMVRPLIELENQAMSTGNIFVLSTEADFQGRSIGSQMLEYAEQYSGKNGMSLVVSDGNKGAKRLYERVGYVAKSSLPMVKKYGWVNSGENWLLMIKPI